MNPSIDCQNKNENHNLIQHQLRIPNPGRSSIDSNRRILGFSSLFLTVIILVYSILLFIQLVLIAYWSNLSYILDTPLVPRTFAWGVIIQFFGSTYDDCKDHSGSLPIQMASHASCRYYHSPSTVPIMALVILVSLTMSAIFYPMEKFIFSYSSNLSFKAMLLSTILTVMLTLRNIIMHCIYFGSSVSFKTEFEKLMRDDMALQEPLYVSPQWQVTQERKMCCGIHNVTDWKFHIFQGDTNPRYPISCCDKMKSNCRVYPSRHEVYDIGCLTPELDLVHEHAGTALGLTMIGLITSITFVFLLYIMNTVLIGEGSVQLRFSKHPNPSLPCPATISVKKDGLYPTLPSLSTALTSNEPDLDSPGRSDQVIVQPLHVERETADEMTISLSDQDNDTFRHKKCSAFTVSRHTSLYVSINSWGIAWRAESANMSMTHVLKKETLV